MLQALDSAAIVQCTSVYEAINVHKSEPEIVTFPPKLNMCALGHSDQLRDYLSGKQHNKNP